MDPERRASFVLRLTRDASRAWRGVIEHVGADRRAAVANEREIGDFIERSLDAPTREEKDRDA
ncbi:MAG TPA: hypothetical protein VGA16_08880 [Candidatus Limnocylindria bacterium]